MVKVRLGFAPLHRYPFDEEWAVEIKNRVIESIRRNLGYVELVYPDENLTKMGLVWGDEDAEKVVELFRRSDVAGIMLGTMTFGDELAGAKIAEEFRGYPILVFGTKEPPTKPGGFGRSDSFCGTLSLTSALYRRKIPFVFAGVVFPEEEEFIKAVDSFARASLIVKEFKGARIGLIGPRPERFETVTFNEAKMAEMFGQRVVHESLFKVIEEARKLGDEDPEVREVVEDMSKVADVSSVPKDALLKMAKFEVVLRRLVKEKNLKGLGIRCWTEIQEYYGISPCFVMGRLTESGIMTSCEVDVYGALTMLIQYLATLKQVPPHFIDWTIRHPEKPNVFLAWHCGNAPTALAHPSCPARVSYHSILYRAVGKENSYGTVDVRLKPGVVTICRLVEYDGEFKMLITKGKVIDEAGEFRGSWSWVEVSDLDKLYSTLVEEGFVHHASIVHGDYVEAIKQACKILGIRTVVI